jgi:hypothetical protein
MANHENLELVRLVFAAKRAPLSLIGKIKDFHDFHRPDFESVMDTVKTRRGLTGVRLLF